MLRHLLLYSISSLVIRTQWFLLACFRLLEGTMKMFRKIHQYYIGWRLYCTCTFIEDKIEGCLNNFSNVAAGLISFVMLLQDRTFCIADPAPSPARKIMRLLAAPATNPRPHKTGFKTAVNILGYFFITQPLHYSLENFHKTFFF
jgi:hypothetical protein